MKKDKITKRRIWVRRSHIKRGLPGSATACPVAIAIQEQLLGHHPKFIDDFDAQQVVVSGRIQIQDTFQAMPLTVSLFVTHFDRGAEVKPFSFLLEVPE